MHWVHLVDIVKAKDIPPDFQPFVDFQARVESIEVSDQEKIAILVVEDTSCYIPVFLETLGSIEELDERLEEQEAQLTKESRDSISKSWERISSSPGVKE